MVNYQLGKIYKIVCNVTDLVYIGSTCEPILARRLAGHMSEYKRYQKGKYKRYLASFDILSNNDYDIVLIESYPCNTKDELHARERYWTNQFKCVNKCKNQGLFNELGQKEYFKIYNKKYKTLKEDQIHAKECEKHNCACGGSFTHHHRANHLKTKKHQQYLEENKIDDK